MADNRGRDGGFRGGRKFEKADRKPGFGGGKRSFGEKKGFAPRGDKPSVSYTHLTLPTTPYV